MREIKFRGLSNQGWVYGDLITSPNGMIKYVQTNKPIEMKDYQKFINQKSLEEDGYYFTNKCIEVDPETVGEFTGLKDKSGKEIYEGDILSAENGKYIGYVKYGESLSYILTKNNEFCIHLYTWSSDYLEIIGNTHQNKELLNEY